MAQKVRSTVEQPMGNTHHPHILPPTLLTHIDIHTPTPTPTPTTTSWPSAGRGPLNRACHSLMCIYVPCSISLTDCPGYGLSVQKFNH